MYPLIMKPNFEGSSIGITASSIVESSKHLDSRIQVIIDQYPAGVILERFIPGIEITVLVIGNKPDIKAVPMALLEASGKLPPQDFIYDYSLKERNGETCEYLWFPAEEAIPRNLVDEAKLQSVRLFEGLGLRDLARFDFRCSRDDKLVFLEANSHPVLDQGNSVCERINSLVLYQSHGVERLFLSAALSRMGLNS